MQPERAGKVVGMGEGLKREYWEKRGPLARGNRGKVQLARQKRSSFLTVRLSGRELTKLRDIAVRQGIGPSTLARIILLAEMNKASRTSPLHPPDPHTPHRACRRERCN